MKSTNNSKNLISQIKNNLLKIIIAIYFGPFIALFIKEGITPLLFGGKEFIARSGKYQIVLIVSYTLLFTAIVFAITSLLEMFISKKHNTSNTQIYLVRITLILWSFLMLWICLKAGIQHDQRAYIQQWQLLLDGEPPWSRDVSFGANTYGPVHTIVGFLMPFGLLVLKFFFVLLLLIANYLIVQELLRERGVGKINTIYLIAVPTNALFIGIGIIYGLNDALVAALIAFAIMLKHRDHKTMTGVFIAIAALVKYYPLLLLPFFALDKKRLDLSIIMSGTICTLVGFGTALSIWGWGPVEAILYNSARGPKFLSILKPLSILFIKNGIIDFLLQYNTFLVIFGVFVTFIFVWKGILIGLRALPCVI